MPKAKTTAATKNEIAEVAKTGEIETSVFQSRLVDGQPQNFFVGKITPKLLAVKLVAGISGKIAGEVKSRETVTTTFGESTRFLGDFRLLDCEGNLFTAGKAFLPDVAASLLNNAFDDLEEGASLDFAFAITLEKADTKTGYQFQIANIKAPSEQEDKLLLLLK